MSHVSRSRGMTVAAFRRRKGGEPLVCLTAYTTPMARLLDPACDLLLVGDSLGMVVYGLPSTVPVTLEMMIAHGGAVVRGAAKSLVIVDLPFGSYQESPAQAFRSAARVMAETGCVGVKLEGGQAMAETIAFLVARGVPVLGHVGLQPQSVHAYGGYGARGKVEAEAERIVADARAVADAGAFAMVVEGVVEPLARRITEAVAGADDRHRRLGRLRRADPGLRRRPGPVRRLPAQVRQAVCRARRHDRGGGRRPMPTDVRARRFPGPEQVYRAGPAPGRASRCERAGDRPQRGRAARAGARLARGRADGRLRADHGRPARRPSGTGAPGAGALRPGRGLDLRQPDPVRAARGPEPLSARRGRRPRQARRASAPTSPTCPPWPRCIPKGPAPGSRSRACRSGPVRRAPAASFPRRRHRRHHAAQPGTGRRRGVRREGLPAAPDRQAPGPRPRHPDRDRGRAPRCARPTASPCRRATCNLHAPSSGGRGRRCIAC